MESSARTWNYSIDPSIFCCYGISKFVFTKFHLLYKQQLIFKMKKLFSQHLIKARLQVYESQVQDVSFPA
jgi:hypothetical protein